MKERFIGFLKRNNAYEAFCNNLANHQLMSYKKFSASLTAEQKGLLLEYWVETIDPQDIITLAFFWESTDEGVKFWEKLNDKWLQWIKN